MDQLCLISVEEGPLPPALPIPHFSFRGQRMKPICRMLTSFAVVAAFSVFAEPASAQVAYGSCQGCGHDYGSRWFGFFEHPYASGRIPTPPYFAIHPPVYYSYAVPRSYGYSPFSYPGTVRTPEIVEQSASKSTVIINPHVKSKVKEASSEKADDKVAERAPKPQLIINPYFQNPQLKAGFELVQHSR